MMRLRTPAAMRAWADARRAAGGRIGLVPTMGCLHEGHVSLVRVAKDAGSEAIAATIFVNPTQFGTGEDFETYPRDEARDLAMLEAAGVDAVYLPGVKDMYPEGHQTFVEVTGVSRGLCGAARPGHFRGVATVVAKLFLAAKPHVAVFGEKDCQQLAVIRAIASADIPVMGHIGLTPQSVHRMGGYRVQGKTDPQRERLLDDAAAVQEAGAFSVVLEGIPAALAAEITRALSIPTIGIGAGIGCDGQVLVMHDLLGLFDEFRPKFVRRFGELRKPVEDAVGAYAAAVRDGSFPGKEHSF